MSVSDVFSPNAMLDDLLTEIEHRLATRLERHMVTVVVEPGDDEAVIEAKRVAALERLGVHPMSVDLTVYVTQFAALGAA